MIIAVGEGAVVEDMEAEDVMEGLEEEVGVGVEVVALAVVREEVA